MKQNLMKKMMVIVTAGILLVGCGNNAKTSGTDKLITKEEATKIALEDAGVSKAEAKNIKIELETDDDVKVYGIDFNTDKVEFEYTVDATTGDVLSGGGEAIEDGAKSKETSPSEDAAITEEKAKEIISQKVQGSTVEDVKLELDKSSEIPTYKGTITYNNATSKFKMDATTGDILSWEQAM